MIGAGVGGGVGAGVSGDVAFEIGNTGSDSNVVKIGWDEGGGDEELIGGMGESWSLARFGVGVNQMLATLWVGMDMVFQY